MAEINIHNTRTTHYSDRKAKIFIFNQLAECKPCIKYRYIWLSYKLMYNKDKDWLYIGITAIKEEEAEKENRRNMADLMA